MDWTALSSMELLVEARQTDPQFEKFPLDFVAGAEFGGLLAAILRFSAVRATVLLPLGHDPLSRGARVLEEERPLRVTIIPPVVVSIKN
jgi:hypothetical protein